MKDAKEKKDARLNIRIEPSLKAEIEKAAKDENRTLANYVTNVLQSSVQDKQAKNIAD